MLFRPRRRLHGGSHNRLRRFRLNISTRGNTHHRRRGLPRPSTVRRRGFDRDTFWGLVRLDRRGLFDHRRSLGREPHERWVTQGNSEIVPRGRNWHSWGHPGCKRLILRDAGDLKGSTRAHRAAIDFLGWAQNGLKVLNNILVQSRSLAETFEAHQLAINMPGKLVGVLVVAMPSGAVWAKTSQAIPKYLV